MKLVIFVKIIIILIKIKDVYQLIIVIQLMNMVNAKSVKRAIILLVMEIHALLKRIAFMEIKTLVYAFCVKINILLILMMENVNPI